MTPGISIILRIIILRKKYSHKISLTWKSNAGFDLQSKWWSLYWLRKTVVVSAKIEFYKVHRWTWILISRTNLVPFEKTTNFTLNNILYKYPSLFCQWHVFHSRSKFWYLLAAFAKYLQSVLSSAYSGSQVYSIQVYSILFTQSHFGQGHY